MKKNANELKPITIHELESSNSSYVWVCNRTSPKGNINLTVSDGMGKSIPVRIPITWIPIDLTTQATKQSLLSNPQFRQLLAKRQIGLIDPNEALEFLNDPEARKENERIYNVGTIDAIGEAQENNAQVSSAIAESSGDLSPFAMNIAVQNDMDEDEVLRELRNRSDELSKADYLYISQNSRQEKVKAYAAERAL